MKSQKPRVIVCYPKQDDGKPIYFIGRIHDSVLWSFNKKEAQQFTDEGEMVAEWKILMGMTNPPSWRFSSPGTEYANDEDVPKIEALSPTNSTFDFAKAHEEMLKYPVETSMNEERDRIWRICMEQIVVQIQGKKRWENTKTTDPKVQQDQIWGFECGLSTLLVFGGLCFGRKKEDLLQEALTMERLKEEIYMRAAKEPK